MNIVMNKTQEAQAIKYSSAKTFAVCFRHFDFVLRLILPLLIGFAAYQFGTGSLVQKVTLGVLAAVSANTVVLFLRVLTPYMLSLSFADMMRLRFPFYSWLFVLVVLIGLTPSCVNLYTSVSVATVQLTLTFLSVASALWFFLNGRFIFLLFAYLCSGVAVGLSAFGVLSILLVYLTGNAFASGLFREGNSLWRDDLAKGAVDYFTKPIVRFRVKWVLLIVFLMGLGAAGGWLVFFEKGALSWVGLVKNVWLSGVNIDGGIVFLVTAVLPLVIVLNRLNHSSDAAEDVSASEIIPCLAVGLLSAGFIALPHKVTSAFGLSLQVDDRLLVLALVFAAFNIIVAALVLMIDIRCRDLNGFSQDAENDLKPQMFFTFFFAIAAPFVLAVAVLGLAAWHRF